MIDLEQLKADREAGTDGPWKIVRYDCGDGDIPDNTPMIDGPDEYDAAVVHWKGFKQNYWSSAHGDDRAIDANASRIARLPELEDTYLEVVAKLDKAVEALEDIKNPIAYLEREAEKSGAEGLNSNAVILAKDYAFLQLLATNALAAIKGSKA